MNQTQRSENKQTNFCQLPVFSNSIVENHSEVWKQKFWLKKLTCLAKYGTGIW